MSLTYTAYVSRNIIKFGGIGVIGLMILWSVTTGLIKMYQAANPPYVAPTVKYGIIPKVIFPDKQFEKKTFTFQLPGDEIPKFKDQAKVFVVYRPIDSFLALENDKQTARQLGFSNEPTPVKTNIYEFRNNVNNQTLTMNILDGSFKMSYPYLNDQLLLNPNNMPSKEEAIVIAESYLSSGNKYADDLKNGEKTASFWKINFDGLKPVSSLSEANIIRVDFFRENIDKDFKIMTDKPGESAISILISGASVETKRLVEVNYKYANIGRDSFSTYPIKTVDTAMGELKNGQYWPALDTNGNSVIIRRIYLAYFEPTTLTNFMQPVYVFEGDDNFTAYVPAVIDEYLQ